MNARLPLEREVRVLFLAGRPDPSDALAAARRGIDWSALYAVAARERATTVLWRVLSQEPGLIPADARKRWQANAMIAEMRLRGLQQSLDALLAALTSASVDVVLLKGAAVAQVAYPRFVDRPMGDLDLLLRPAALEQALHIAAKLGWRDGPFARHADAYVEHHHLPPLIDDRQNALELHHDLFDTKHPFRFTAAEVWTRSVPSNCGRGRTPAPSDLIIHACLHLAWSHMLASASWRTFRDLAALESKHLLDWDLVAAEAERVGATTAAYWTFRLGRSLGGLAVPDGILNGLKPPRRAVTLRTLERHLAMHLTGQPCPSVRLRMALWEAAMMPEWSGYGEARPWRLAPLFPSKDEGPKVVGLSKVGHHLKQLPAYASYLRKLMIDR